MVIYTPEGASTTKEVDFKSTGRLSYHIRLATELNIPVFNLAKENAKEECLKFIETFA